VFQSSSPVQHFIACSWFMSAWLTHCHAWYAHLVYTQLHWPSCCFIWWWSNIVNWCGLLCCLWTRWWGRTQVEPVYALTTGHYCPHCRVIPFICLCKGLHHNTYDIIIETNLFRIDWIEKTLCNCYIKYLYGYGSVDGFWYATNN